VVAEYLGFMPIHILSRQFQRCHHAMLESFPRARKIFDKLVLENAGGDSGRAEL
jgi:hypothetical protein